MRLLFLVCCATALIGAERINHEGRILGQQATVTTAVQFNTAQADAIIATMQIMPTDSAWNEDIRARPLLGNSTAMITKIRNDVYDAPNNYSNRRRLVVFQEMNYVLVPNNQPLVGIRFVTYPDDSDFNGGTNPIATWPVPSMMPIETWPTGTGAQTLEQWQRAGGGDRHSIVVQPGIQRVFETWEAQLTNNTPNWQASNGAIFSLDNNAARPPGWTSGDAAGLPMLPALVRYDECQRGVIEHAMRIVVKCSRQSYIYPASHQAGSTTDADTPAMGQRLRLKSSFVIPASWSAQERAVAVALKKYGALVADNGSFFSISICPDDRWPSGCWNHFSTGAATDILDINQFDVVQTTGENEGPRAAGKPGADAGSDQNVILAAGAALMGVVSGGGSAQWSVYPADGPQATQVHFASPNSATTTVTFDVVGSYTLLLAANKSGFTPAYDAVIVTVTASGGSNPVPTLSSISPSSVTTGSGGFTLTVAGNNFLPSSTITWSGQVTLLPLTATANQMTVAIPLSYVSASGTPLVRVVNPIPGGGASTAQTMVIAAAPSGGATSDGGSSGGGGGGCGFGGVAAVIGMLFVFTRLRL